MYAYSINKLTLLVLFISEKNLVSQCSLQCVYTCNKYEQPSINKHRDIGITVDISCQFQLNLYTMHSTSCTEPSESQHLLDNSACRTICLTRIKKIQNISIYKSETYTQKIILRMQKKQIKCWMST